MSGVVDEEVPQQRRSEKRHRFDASCGFCLLDASLSSSYIKSVLASSSYIKSV